MFLNLIWLIFVIEIEGGEGEIFLMLGIECLMLEGVKCVVDIVMWLGILVICIFFYFDFDQKIEICECVWDFDNIGNCVICVIKEVVFELVVMIDIVLDFYNVNGYDGIVCDGVIVNDEIVEVLVCMVLVQVEVGVDILGFLDMMDGCIVVLCVMLEMNGYQDVVILFYVVKYVSGFYGLFCDVVGVLGWLVGDKKIYQMNFVNCDEVMCCVVCDLVEGVDMVMVKFGMFYLDICCMVKDQFVVLIYVYQVSGEYVMMEGVICNGWLLCDVVMESLLFFCCVGCDGILIYYVLQVVEKLV